MISSDSLSLLFKATGDTEEARKAFNDLRKSINKDVSLAEKDISGTDFSTFSRNIQQNITDKVRQAGQSISNLGKSLTIGLTAPIAAVATLGVNFNATKEQALVAFGVLLKSGEKAKQLFSDLTKFAAETPFEINGINQSTKSLLAFGVAQKDIIPTLKAIGDIASGTGTPLNELAELYGKAKVQGRLFAEDINQLTGRGIPIIQELAKQFGVSDDKVKELVESGKIGFPQLEKAFQSLTKEGGQFSGMMEAQSQTFSGRLSTLMDGLNTGLGKITEPLFNALSNLMPYVIGFVERISESFSNLSPTMQLVISIMAGVAAAVGPVLLVIGSLVTGFAALIPVLAPVISGIGAFVSLVGAAGLGATLSAIASVVGGALVSAITAALPLIAGIAAAIAGLTVVAAAVVASVVALYVAWQNNFGGLKDFTTEVFSGIKTFINTAMTEISGFINSQLAQIKAFWKANGDDITAAVKTVYQFLESIVKTFLDKIRSFWQENGETIKTIVSAAWNAVKTIFANSINIILNVIKLFSAAINGDWSAAWEAAKQIVLSVVGNIKTILSTLGSIAIASFKLLLSAIVSVSASIIQAAVNLGKAIIQGIVSAIKNGVSLVTNAIRDLAASAIEKAKSVFGIASPSKVFIQFGEDIINGLIIGLEKGRSGVTQTISSLGNELISVFRELNIVTASQKTIGEKLSELFGEEKLAGLIQKLAEKANLSVDAFKAQALAMAVAKDNAAALMESYKKTAQALEEAAEQIQYFPTGITRPGSDQGIYDDTGGEEEEQESPSAGDNNDPDAPPSLLDPSFLDRLQERLETGKQIIQEFGGVIQNVTAGSLEALDALANRVGDLVNQWVLYGNTGKSVLKQLGDAIRRSVAERLAAIAAESAVQAVYATALGFLRLAMYDFSGAAKAFISAAKFAAVAGVSAIAGRVIAGNTFSRDSGGQQAYDNQTNQNSSFSQRNNTNNRDQTINYDEDRLRRKDAASKVFELRVPRGMVTREVLEDFNSAGPMRDVVLKMVET